MPLRRLPDRGDDETERLLAEIEKRISGEYAKAEREIQQKLNDYLAKFQKKDELKRRALAAGEITQAEYDKWRLGQIMIGQRWDEMRTTLAEDLANVDQIARSIAFGHLPEVYAINHNYGTFQVETGALVDTSYTLYDRHTVERLCLDDDGRFIPSHGRRISEEINLGKALPWNKKNVQSVMMQGIMQGESIPNLATRLAKSVGEQNRGVAIRNARTLVTGVQNAGRMDSYDRAKDMGIKVKKQWLATLDMRTRHWHVELDGVSVDVDEPFENEYGTIMFPGDPEADPSNIYNCRCTMIAAIEGFERDLSDLGLRHDDHLEGMTYDEWKEEHETYSEPITRQDQIAATMRRIYGSEYAHYATLPQIDAMGDVSVMHIPGRDVDVKLYQVEDGPIFTQTHTANAQRMTEIVKSKFEEFGSPKKTVILKYNTLSGFSAYDRVGDVFYISEELADHSWFEKNVDTSFFAAQSLDDVFAHELGGHRNHWSAVREYYQQNSGRLSSIEDAKFEKETDLREYVSRQMSMDRLYLSRVVSRNASDGFMFGNSLNETVADGIVVADDISDKELLRLIRQVITV